jgi:hypothetical protein
MLGVGRGPFDGMAVMANGVFGAIHDLP